MRAGEVCGLQRHDLDPDRATVVVRRTLTNGRLGPTKTRQARTVSLLHPTVEEVAEWRPGATVGSRLVLDALRGLRVRSLLPEAPLFLRGDAAWPSWALHAEWRRILTAAGVRYREPEQLRHTFASTMLCRATPPCSMSRSREDGGARRSSCALTADGSPPTWTGAVGATIRNPRATRCCGSAGSGSRKRRDS